jgi:signal transduction histidine kinase
MGLRAPVQTAREEEREWVRGHLHDTALQILEFIAGDGFATGLSTAQIGKLAGGAARDLHRWIDAAESLTSPQLVPQLEQVAREARRLDPSVELIVGRLSSSPSGPQATAIAGAVREALTNARKHANASKVVIYVESDAEGRTAVTVTDDGVGIDPERFSKSTGLGVKGSIVGRMERVGGVASLQQAPNGGTRVTLVTSTEES